MKKQTVVRTYPNGWTNTTRELKEYLNNGWTVVCANPVKDGIIEYIVEHDDNNQEEEHAGK